MVFPHCHGVWSLLGLLSQEGTSQDNPASLFALGPGGRRHRLGSHSGASLAEPWSEPHPVSGHAGEVLPGADLPGVRGGPGQGAEGVLRQIPPARRHREAAPAPA